MRKNAEKIDVNFHRTGTLRICFSLGNVIKSSFIKVGFWQSISDCLLELSGTVPGKTAKHDVVGNISSFCWLCKYFFLTYFITSTNLIITSGYARARSYAVASNERSVFSVFIFHKPLQIDIDLKTCLNKKTLLKVNSPT